MRKKLKVNPQEYTVTWTIDVTASSPVDAARQALEIQRDPGSEATVFEVETFKNRQVVEKTKKGSWIIDGEKEVKED
jgi:hypothetical protein